MLTQFPLLIMHSQPSFSWAHTVRILLTAESSQTSPAVLLGQSHNDQRWGRNHWACPSTIYLCLAAFQGRRDSLKIRETVGNSWAIGTSDMPLFNGGVIHTCQTPHITPHVALHVAPAGSPNSLIYKVYTANRVPRYSATKCDSAHVGPFPRLWEYCLS